LDKEPHQQDRAELPLFVTLVVDLRFLRRASRPNAPRPLAKSGKEAGSGISDRPEIPEKLIPVTVGTLPPIIELVVVLIETDVKSVAPVNVKSWEVVTGAKGLDVLFAVKLFDADAPSLPVAITSTIPPVMKGAEALTVKITSVNCSGKGMLTVLPMTVALVWPIGTAVGSAPVVSVAA